MNDYYGLAWESGRNIAPSDDLNVKISKINMEIQILYIFLQILKKCPLFQNTAFSSTFVSIYLSIY